MKAHVKRRYRPPITVYDIMALIYLYPVRWLSRLLPVRLQIGIVKSFAPLYVSMRPGVVKATADVMFSKVDGAETRESALRTAREWLRRDLRKTADDIVMRRVDIDELAARSSIQGLEHLDQAVEQGRGAIIVSGHFHANRMAKFLLRRRGYSMVSLRHQAPRSEHLGRFGMRVVPRAYGRFLSGNVEDDIPLVPSDRGAVVFKKLRNNEIVNLHIDVFRRAGAIPSTLLGWEWFFPAGFINLAELTGAPLIPMLCRGDSDALDIRFFEPIRYRGRSDGEELARRFEPIQVLLDGWLRENPADWEIWSRVAVWKQAKEQSKDRKPNQ